MARAWHFLLAMLMVGVLSLLSTAIGQDKKEDDDIPPPTEPSAIQLFVEGEEVKDIAELDPEVIKQLTAAARGGKSSFPTAVFDHYTRLLAQGPSPTATLNKAIVVWCGSKVGSQVGNGQCAVLCDEALKAKTIKAKRYPPYGSNADYVWGNLVATVRKGEFGQATNIQPGDMLQFRNATFKGKYTMTSGTQTRTWSWSYSAGHHSAVVAAVSKDRRVLKVYESNINGNLRTQYGYYALGDMTGGWVKAYRPVKG